MKGVERPYCTLPTARQRVHARLGVLDQRRRALAVRIAVRAATSKDHWIAVGPALVSTAEEIDEMVALLDQSIGEILNDTAGNGRKST